MRSWTPVTDIATGWTENQTVPDKRQVHVVAAVTEVVNGMPFPVRGIDCDNGGEFINDQLYRYCREHKLKFTRIDSAAPASGPSSGFRRDCLPWNRVAGWPDPGERAGASPGGEC